jgi:hypothetical protein
MRTKWTGLCLALCGLSFVASCSDAGGELGAEQGEIIRATSNGGRDQVVMIYATAIAGGQIVHRTCSGSYYAPRVVVTAAHCLQNIFGDNVFVYWGDNFTQDFAELTDDGFFGFIPPPIGAPSHWAQADSFQSHPSYDANANSADLGVVFLDRKPPFDPLPLYRSSVNAGVQVTVTGWGANSAPTPTTGAGAQVQRTGKTVTLGSPTAADYHPDDPNPGMLDPAVRATVIKTDGHTPKSNPCFGDSGGPIILNQFGQDYIAGVGYWVGLSCEEYSLFNRISSFLPFFDLSYKRGGQDVLKPTFTCVTPNPSGSLTAIFGYQNDNGVGISIPQGSKNVLARDTANLRPTRFDPGLHTFGFGVDFTAGQTVSWTLSPDNNPTTTVTATAGSTACSAAQSVDTGCILECRAQLRSGCAAAEEFDNCSARCAEIGRSFVGTGCDDERVAYQNCVAGTAPGAANWTCQAAPQDSLLGPGPQSRLCAAQQDAYVGCVYYGYGYY